MEMKEILNLARVPSILLLGLVYGTFVLIGGVVFWKLEGDLGREDIRYILVQREQVLKNYTCLGTDGLNTVIQIIQEASKAGLSLKGNHTSDGFWKFTSSAVFAATVVTTIGYGNISPRTPSGQIFCVFFALFGIPLNVVVLNRVGKYMLVIERNICDLCQGKTRHKRSARFFVHLVSYLTGAVLFFIVPMVVFKEHEDWTYAEAIYYCFITLSTIGFGDYVADSNPYKAYPEWYSVLLASWIFFGLVWLALVINHSIDILEQLTKQWSGHCHARGQEEAGSESGNPDCDALETQVELEEQMEKKHPA